MDPTSESSLPATIATLTPTTATTTATTPSSHLLIDIAASPTTSNSPLMGGESEASPTLTAGVTLNVTSTTTTSSSSTTTSTPSMQSLPELVQWFSSHTISLLIPVATTMLVVVWATHTLSPLLDPNMTRQQMPMYLIYDEKPTDAPTTKLSGALLNALVVVATFTVVTLALVGLYKYRCYRCLALWFAASTFWLLFVMSWMWVDLLCTALQLPYDVVTVLGIVCWNFAVLGVVSLYWHGSKSVAQVYLVCVAVMVGWYLTRLPEWTTWGLLLATAAYDIVAVLTPRGPLKMLVEESQRRNEPVPGLIYESKLFKLGLGDFVFYSLLVGRAALFSDVSALLCALAVLLGLCVTLLALSLHRQALPALPVSIGLGVAMYLVSRPTVVPYVVGKQLNAVLV